MRWSSEQLESPEELAQTALPDQNISLIDLCLALVERWKQISCTALAFAILACAVALILPNRYTAVTSLLPPQQNQSLGYALLSQVTGTGALASMAGRDLGLKNPNDLYVAMLQSRAVEDPLISRFELMTVYKEKRLSNARKELEKNTEIRATKEGLIRLSVEDKDPQRAAAIANFYTEQLQRLTSTLALTEAGQRRLFFEHQLEGIKNQLSDAERALKETQQKTGLIQLDSQSKALIEAVGRVRAEIASKEIELQTFQTFATEQNPDYVVAKRQLDGLRAQLAKLETQQTGPLGDVQMPTEKIPEVGLEYLRRLRDVKYYENLFEFLAKQAEVAKLDEARQGALIQTVDPAFPPDKKSSPKRLLIVLVATILGLLLSIIYILLIEAWNHMPISPEQRRRLDRIRRRWLRTSRVEGGV